MIGGARLQPSSVNTALVVSAFTMSYLLNPKNRAVKAGVVVYSP